MYRQRRNLPFNIPLVPTKEKQVVASEVPVVDLESPTRFAGPSSIGPRR